MKNLLKSILATTIFIAILFIIVALAIQKSHNTNTLNIIATNFPGYDFARAITKDVPGVSVKMLLKPGADSHSYEPTPNDIIDIQNSDLFIYTGGDSDTWATNLLQNLTITDKAISMLDLVTLSDNDHHKDYNTDEHSDHDHTDEHVWTSLKNSIQIISALRDRIIDLDPSDQDLYLNNADTYINDLSTLDQAFQDLVANAKRKTIIFGDRFPIRHFANDYGLTYFSAFPGCSEQTEVNAKTISELIDKVKAENIPVVFRTELSNGQIAQIIADATSAKVSEFHSAHNLSKDDFDSGLTYLTIMQNNFNALKEALY